jgi:PTH1 family peptidyl-tRNA hydrolase
MFVRKNKFVDQKSRDFASLCNTLIVGLGNPSLNWTRHNVGSDLLRVVIEKYVKRPLASNLFCVFFDGFCSFVLLAPDLMNISGAKIFNIYQKLGCKNLILAVDDLDTKIGSIKKSFATTSNGHNGVKSVIENFGHNRFWKIKIGIGRPETREVKDYVLEKFLPQEREIILGLEKTFEENLQEIYVSFN